MLSLTFRLVGTLGLFALVGCPEPTDDASADKDVDTSTDTDDSAIDTGDSDTGGDTGRVDADNDGSPEGEDCDDADATRTPGRAERCDSVDNDCDDVVDNNPVDGDTFYGDADADGFGVGSTTITACSAPAGYSDFSTDCDDAAASSYPGATEYCNGADDNCNGATDENTAADAQTFYADNDGDSYGNAGSSAHRCEAPVGYVTDGTDCDDFDANQFPGATEYCNDDDDDCDGDEDESDAVDPSAWYADTDEDGYGDATVIDWSCNAANGFVADDTDCDDTVATTNPAATESCDGADNNCDGNTDESTATNATTWYADADDDTFGDSTTRIISCNAPSGYVEISGDCLDSDGDVNPDALEVCDGLDNDCDAGIDDEYTVNLPVWYKDNDSDTFGNPNLSRGSCEMPTGYVANDDDCNDGNQSINPDETETCDGSDNNCDGQTDEAGATGTATWYADTDADGFGDATNTMAACTVPPNYVGDATDCDDGNSELNPDQTEICDAIDNDCDSVADEGVTVTAYDDADGDGFGDEGTAVAVCTATVDQVVEGGDCDDDDWDVYPGAAELCDGQQNDCDTAWTETDEDGLVSFWAADAAGTDVTAAFTGYYELSNGEYAVCEGSYAVELGAYRVTTSVEALHAGTVQLTKGGSEEILGAIDSTIQLSGLAFVGGDALQGGAIFANGSDLQVSDCVFTDNSAQTYGGAILSALGSSLAVSNSVFEGSTAGYGGAAIYSTGALSVSDTSFAQNDGGFGSAILQNEASTVTIDRCDFSDNTASTGGSAIAVSGGTIQINDSTFQDNVSTGWGGAISAGSSSLSILASAFTNNSAVRGGAIDVSTAAVTVIDSEFAKNSATDFITGAGGAFYLGGGSGAITAGNVTFGTAADANSPSDVGLGFPDTAHNFAAPADFMCTATACN